VFIRASLGVGGVEWAPYEIFEGAGNFEVLQDPRGSSTRPRS